jgi:hypothetical protein
MLEAVSAPLSLPPLPAVAGRRHLGRGANRILAALLILSLVGGTYYAMANKEELFIAMLLMFLAAFALVALPAVLFEVHARREGALPLTRGMRAAVAFSALCVLSAGAWLAYWLWPTFWTAGALLLVAFGALVMYRAWRAAPAPPDGARLAYGGSTVMGLLFLVLGAAAVPKFACGCGESPYLGTLRSDLRNVAVAQELHLLDHSRFARSREELDTRFRPSAGVALSLLARGDTGWYAVAHAGDYRDVCGIWVGAPPPDGMHGAPEGEPVCWKR